MSARSQATARRRLGAACLAPALLWLGCNALWGTDELSYLDQSSEAGGTTNSGGAGGTTTTTTTTSTGGGGGTSPCEGLVDFGMGETAECQDCVAEQCCKEYLACGPGESCDALMACATPEGACGQDCLYPICDSGFAYPFHYNCATCMGNNCCNPLTECAADTVCTDCIASGGATCAYSALYDLVTECQATNCTDECNGGGD